MNEIRSVGAALCIAAFSAGTLELLFPDGRLKEVINIVLGVYILTSAVSGLQAPDARQLLQELYAAASQKVDYEDFNSYVTEQYQAALESAENQEVKSDEAME